MVSALRRPHRGFGSYASIFFLGISDRASPRLKDADIDKSVYPSLYEELILNVRKLFHQCKLVHADLSEYNILYHNGHLYIIDVSQSVEQDHPSAFDFLRSDLKNVEDFFSKMGVQCLGLRRCFEFVTREKLDAAASEEGDEAALQRWLQEAPVEEPPTVDDGTADADPRSAAETSAAHEDEVFRKSYIPRTLNELYNPERDVDAVLRGDGNKLIYADTIGLVRPSSPDDPQSVKTVHFDDTPEAGEPSDSDEHDEGDDVDENDDEEESAADGEFVDRPSRGHRHEDREAKKASPLFRWSCSHAHGTAGAQESNQGRAARKAQDQDAQGREEEETKGDITRMTPFTGAVFFLFGSTAVPLR